MMQSVVVNHTMCISSDCGIPNEAALPLSINVVHRHGLIPSDVFSPKSLSAAPLVHNHTQLETN